MKIFRDIIRDILKYQTSHLNLDFKYFIREKLQGKPMVWNQDLPHTSGTRVSGRTQIWGVWFGAVEIDETFFAASWWGDEICGLFYVEMIYKHFQHPIFAVSYNCYMCEVKCCFFVEPSQLGVFLVKQTEMYIFPDASRFVFLQPLSKLQSLRTSTLLGGHGDFNAVCLWIFLGDGFSNSPGVQRCWSLGIFWWDAYGCWISGIWYCWCFF